MKITNTLKEKSKEICTLLAYVMAATLITSPLAFAASPFEAVQETVNTKFKTTSDYAAGCSDNNTSRSCFSAGSYDDLDGVLQGSISISSYSRDDYGSYGNYSFISCSGTAYAGIVSTNQSNGKTTIKATLNPSDPSCSSYNWNVGSVTVNLSGTYTDGGYRSSSNSTSTVYYNGTTSKYNNKYDYFEETFTGFITSFTTPLTGIATVSRNSNRQEVK